MKTIKYYSTLREASYHRQREWCGGEPQVPLLFRTTEMAGEVGEALECIADGNIGELPSELADVIITADLLAADLGIDLPLDSPGVMYRERSHFGLALRLGAASGAVCNQVKKMERKRLGWRGSEPDVELLARKLRVIVNTTFYLAYIYGVDLMGGAIEQKFNETGEKLGLETRLSYG